MSLSKKVNRWWLRAAGAARQYALAALDWAVPGGPSTSRLGVMRIAMPLAALALTICVSVGHGGETDVADLPFDVLRTGAIGGETMSQLTLARDEISYRAMWAQLKVPATVVDPGTAPGVDFDHWMVVAFFDSGPGGSCRHFRLTQVLARPDKVTLHISEEGVESCICISEPVGPYIIAKIPWTEKPIDFKIERQLHDCRS